MARPADPALRDKVIDAAREVFRIKGFSAARMSDIAAQAGVSVGSIYMHFKTKESLCSALADLLNRRILDESLPLMAHANAAQGIADATRMALRIFTEERDMLAILCLNMGFGPFEDRFENPSETDEQVFGALALLIESRMETGEFRREDVMQTVHLIANLIERTAIDCLLLGAGELSDYEGTVVRFIQNALLVKPPVQDQAQ